MLPAKPVEPLVETLQETAVGVDYRNLHPAGGGASQISHGAKDTGWASVSGARGPLPSPVGNNRLVDRKLPEETGLDEDDLLPDSDGVVADPL